MKEELLIYSKYFWTVVRHKCFILMCLPKAGYLAFGRLLMHDMSKFYPDEFFPYARYWETMPEERTPEVIAAFEEAWALHVRRNKHHWEHWVRRDDQRNSYSEPMDWNSISEMFCDWRAAGLAYNGVDDSRDYFLREGPEMLLHPETRQEIEFFYEVSWREPK